MLMYSNLLLAIFLARGARLRMAIIGLVQCFLVETFIIELAYYMRVVGRIVVPAFFATAIILLFLERQTAAERAFCCRFAPGDGPVR